MIDRPSINGKMSNSNSVRLLILNQPIYGVKEINYAPMQQEVQANYTLDNEPYGLSFGQISYGDCTIKVYRPTAIKLVRIMATLPDRFQTPVNIETTVRTSLTDVEPQHDLLEGCGLKGISEFAASAGTVDALTLQFTFVPTRIWFNGVPFGKVGAAAIL